MLESSSARGYEAELIVMQVLVKHGYIVSTPVAYAAYDIVAEHPQSHRLMRIQVKRGYMTNKHPGESLRWGYHSRCRAGVYDATAFDYMAVVLPEESIVLFIPWEGQHASAGTILSDDELAMTELPQ